MLRSRPRRRRSPRRPTRPRPTRPKARAEEQKRKAAAKVEELQTQLDAAKANGKSKLDAAAAAQDAAKAAETGRADAAKAASDAKLALEPVSIFISRATQKLYVRRNTQKRGPYGGQMFDTTIEVPVTIRNPDKPIGTHVFTAVARTDRGLRWTAVTIESGEGAKAALDRITLPQDVLDRIAPTALPRSSLIISDEPLHRETNFRTEFVVALSDQPQGGIINRPRSPDVRVGYGGVGLGWLGLSARARPVLRSAAVQSGLLSAAAPVVTARRAASGPHGTQGMRTATKLYFRFLTHMRTMQPVCVPRTCRFRLCGRLFDGERPSPGYRRWGLFRSFVASGGMTRAPELT